MKEFVKEAEKLERFYKDSIEIYGNLNVTKDRYETLVKIKNLYTAQWKWGHKHQVEMKRLIAEITGYDILEIQETLKIIWWELILLVILMIIGIANVAVGIALREVEPAIPGVMILALSILLTIELMIGA